MAFLKAFKTKKLRGSNEKYLTSYISNHFTPIEYTPRCTLIHLSSLAWIMKFSEISFVKIVFGINIFFISCDARDSHFIISICVDVQYSPFYLLKYLFFVGIVGKAIILHLATFSRLTDKNSTHQNGNEDWNGYDLDITY